MMKIASALLFLLLLLAPTACLAPPHEPESAPANEAVVPLRIAVFGDVHGDLDATRRALRLTGAVNDSDHWIGGEMVVVQTGDVLDRGDGEQAILELFVRLEEEAAAAGGAFHFLLGNHEVMNVAGDLRYVTPGGFADFEGVVTFDPEDPDLARIEPDQRARAAAFRPGSPYAILFAEQDVILLLDGNVFVHGGVLPHHLDHGIERIHAETESWLRGEGERPAILTGPKSPIWTRAFSDQPKEGADALLDEVLDRLDADRMIMGHTVQEGGIGSGFEQRVWCIDVGMSHHYGGPVEVLLIEGDEVRIVREER
jgi:hypothetical protein